MQMVSIINVFIMQIDIFKNNQTELATTDRDQSDSTCIRILSEKHIRMCVMSSFT